MSTAAVILAMFAGALVILVIANVVFSFIAERKNPPIGSDGQIGPEMGAISLHRMLTHAARAAARMAAVRTRFNAHPVSCY